MQASDVKIYLSGASNTDPDLSLGGVISVEVSAVPLNNLFRNVTEPERTSGLTDYRCIYVRNDSPDTGLTNTRVFISTQTPSSQTAVELGIDLAPVGNGTTTGVAEIIPDEVTEPEDVIFESPSSIATSLVIGDLNPGQCRALWVRRIVDPGALDRPIDNFVLKVIGRPAT